MPVIRLTTEINAPVESVFDLARSIDLHVETTSQTNERAVAGRKSGLIELGESVTWEATHFYVRQQLTVRITKFKRPWHFRDTLVKGAFSRFDHDHFFESTDAGTVMTDVFDFASPLGVLGQIANWLLVKRHMRNLLYHRNQVIKSVAESSGANESTEYNNGRPEQSLGQVSLKDGRQLKRNHFRRFSLLTLILTLTAVCIWLGILSNRATNIRRATEQLTLSGCDIGFDYELDGLRKKPAPVFPAPEFMRQFLGDEYFVDIATLSFQGNDATTNADLAPIRMLANVRRLDLDYTRIDDLSAVKDLHQLRWLDLEETEIDDEDLDSLRELSQLEILVLTRNSITDDGIANLTGLTNLRELRLNETDVTDAGLRRLEQLTYLRNLELSDTQVTAAGVAQLKKQLPNCRIEWDGAVD